MDHLHNFEILIPYRMKIKIGTYHFKDKSVTIETLIELHGEIISKPTIKILKDNIILSDEDIIC